MNQRTLPTEQCALHIVYRGEGGRFWNNQSNYVNQQALINLSMHFYLLKRTLKGEPPSKKFFVLGWPDIRGAMQVVYHFHYIYKYQEIKF